VGRCRVVGNDLGVRESGVFIDRGTNIILPGPGGFPVGRERPERQPSFEVLGGEQGTEPGFVCDVVILTSVDVSVLRTVSARWYHDTDDVRPVSE
jgi:hypothetical protein